MDRVAVDEFCEFIKDFDSRLTLGPSQVCGKRPYLNSFDAGPYEIVFDQTLNEFQ
jgi:hypothetical protein